MWISAINHGVCELVNSISAELNAPELCMWAISSYLREQMTSRSVYTVPIPAAYSPVQARLASTTAWIANPKETVQLLDELEELEKAN